MMKIYFFLTFLLFSLVLNAQINGIVKNNKGDTLAFVNVFIKNTYNGTTTNDNGQYILKLKKKGSYTIVFQFLGFKTVTKDINVQELPYILDVVMKEDAVSLAEVAINSKTNPANKIIKQAIAKRKENKEKTAEFLANFYSKAIYRVKNAPEKIFGFELGDLGGGLDSTRSGVLYLSETISKITKSKNNFKEKIIASKVSGDDSGFSFNQASEVDFNFYNNAVEIGENIISPIASYAFNYYKYKLVASYYEQDHLINKIKVTPKQKTDNAFNGYIYIVEDNWQLFAVDVFVTGKQMQQPMIEKLILKQNYSYNEKDKFWAIFSQSIDFKFAIFGFNVDGRSTAVYSDYNFHPNFGKRTFTREILSFNEKANKKDSLFWKQIRPVPLTFEEKTDYHLKDSIKVIRKSKKYLDSLDAKSNKFKWNDVFFGYNHSNQFDHQGWSIGSPLNSLFNTVQGWHSNINLSFYKYNKEEHTNFWAKADLDYGLSDKQFRPSGRFTYKFNDISKPTLTLQGGRKLMQFNPTNSTNAFINGISTLFFEKNFAKFYDKTYASVHFGKEITNGVRLQTSLAYEDRKPVFNTSEYITINHNNIVYTSNNPLDSNDYTNAVIEHHNIYKFTVATALRFKQEYISYPKEKQNTFDNRYPKLNISYTKGFAANDKKYNFDFVQARIFQSIQLDNKGQFSYNIKAGKFINSEELSFVDYKHFNGNQTHVNLGGNYTNSFALLPYYDFSTNKEFAETHITHQFNGYVLRKIPLINKLQFKLNIGAKALFTTNKKPYTEFNVGLSNLGFGKYRFLRVDYVRSLYNSKIVNGFMFGISM